VQVTYQLQTQAWGCCQPAAGIVLLLLLSLPSLLLDMQQQQQHQSKACSLGLCEE
jgi:hypothetical protein